MKILSISAMDSFGIWLCLPSCLRCEEKKQNSLEYGIWGDLWSSSKYALLSSSKTWFENRDLYLKRIMILVARSPKRIMRVMHTHAKEHVTWMTHTLESETHIMSKIERSLTSQIESIRLCSPYSWVVKSCTFEGSHSRRSYKQLWFFEDDSDFRLKHKSILKIEATYWVCKWGEKFIEEQNFASSSFLIKSLHERTLPPHLTRRRILHKSRGKNVSTCDQLCFACFMTVHEVPLRGHQDSAGLRPT